MSIDQGVVSGGRNIIPSARKGIHNHSGCSEPTREDMGRYGEDSSEDEAATREGTDVVDNAMSKFSPTSSPLGIRRRSSMTPPNQQYMADSDDDVLAKSLPATLPSYYSEEFGGWHSHGSSLSHHNNISQHDKSGTPAFSSRSNRSAESLNSRLSPIHNQSRRKEDNKSSEGTIFKYLLPLLAACSLAYYYDLMNPTFETNGNKYDELKFHSDLSELGTRYKVGVHSVLQLQAGISTIFKREDTSCFIFVYNSMADNFNSNQFDDFVNNVASNTAKFLRNESAPVPHVAVDAAALGAGTHSELVRAYRERVARAGVLVVRDVARVPPPLAMAFHYYCDEYNPLVRRSAVFFTLDAARCHNSGEKSSHASVEKCLKEKWRAVPSDNIGPLLTRVVGVVVDVTDL